MESTSQPLEITGLPVYIASWSVASVPGFILSVLDRWQRNHGRLPSHFKLVACPQLEINENGGLPSRVRELTDARIRVKHLTSCNKPYLVILLFDEDAEARREEIQNLLSWSEGYHVDLMDGMTKLQFIDAIEDVEDIDYAVA
jgi:hypothetical protein